MFLCLENIFQKCDYYHYCAKNVLGSSWNRNHASYPDKLAIKGANLAVLCTQADCRGNTAVQSEGKMGCETPDKHAIQVWKENCRGGKDMAGPLYGNKLPSKTAPSQNK